MTVLNSEAPVLADSSGEGGAQAEAKDEAMAGMKRAWESDWFVL
jgi:hypothetical protein